MFDFLLDLFVCLKPEVILNIFSLKRVRISPPQNIYEHSCCSGSGRDPSYIGCELVDGTRYLHILILI